MVSNKRVEMSYSRKNLDMEKAVGGTSLDTDLVTHLI